MAANTASQKAQYLQATKEIMSELGRLNERMATMVKVFADRQYDGAAADAVTDAELVNFGVIQYDLGAAVLTMQQLNAFFDGQSTSPNLVYGATINKWRQV